MVSTDFFGGKVIDTEKQYYGSPIGTLGDDTVVGTKEYGVIFFKKDWKFL